MTSLNQRLRRLELALLETFDGGTLQLEHARRAVAEIDELCKLRAAGSLDVDPPTLLAVGMVCVALLFVLRCAIAGEQLRRSSSSSSPVLAITRCEAVSHGALSPTGTRCALRAGHFGDHLFAGFPRQCDATRTDPVGTFGGTRQQRCRLLQHHDGQHVYDDHDDERDST